jgi:hypothetical protein
MRARLTRSVAATLGTLAAGPAAIAATTLEPPVIIGKYYEQNGFVSCTDGVGCGIIFAKTPAGKTLTVERVACNTTSKPFPLATVDLGALKRSELTRRQPTAHAVVAKEALNGTPVHFGVLYHQTRFAVRVPTVVAFSTSSAASDEIRMSCQISGTLSP